MKLHFQSAALLLSAALLIHPAPPAHADVQNAGETGPPPAAVECRVDETGADPAGDRAEAPNKASATDGGEGGAAERNFGTAAATDSPNALPEQDRQEVSLAITENAQGAFLLRQLLLGRQFKLFGKVEGDVAGYEIPSFIDQDGGELRSLRVGIAGLNPWFDNISYKLEFDLTDGSSSLSSAYLNVDFGERGALIIGNQDGSQSLSASTGRLSQLFMESPLAIEAFGLGKRLGVSFERYRTRYGLYALVFGQDLNTNDKHRGGAARAYFNPYRSRAGIWHVGMSLVREDFRGKASLSSRPESHVTDIKLVNTGNLEDVKSDRRLGLEVAGATGSFTTRLEVMFNDWKRQDGSRNRFIGAYLEGGLFITGEAFRYVRGKFVRPRLQESRAAWELAYRLSWLDLNDGDVDGGEERNFGLALNYYPRPDLRAQLNAIQVNSDRPDSDGLLLQARLQFNW